MADLKNSVENSNSPVTEENFIEIPNPYSPYDIESGRWFYSEDVIKQIEKQFKSHPPRKAIVLQGSTGAGKTSTLIRIIEHPSLIGKKHIPVYLNLGESKPTNAGQFFITAYRAIKEKTDALGIQIEEPDYTLSSSISLNEMEFFIQKMEKKLDKHTVIISIFDEIDKLYEASGEQLISSVFEYFQNIMKKTAKQKFILAADRNISEFGKDMYANAFLNTALLIKIEDILDIHKIKSLIVEPVKAYLKYNQSAIEEIIRITGNNLYCQQLLCHYLINYLNENRKNVCTKTDVKRAAELTISDQREDFTYFWSGMPYKSKLVAAALADETITKRKGQYYFLEESTLLDAIFNETTLDEILAGLFEDSYINKMYGRRFLAEPYQTPLIRQWVQKNHSFLQTVIENWAMIANQVSLAALGEIIEMIPPKILPLGSVVINTVVPLSWKWSEIKKSLEQRQLEKNQLETLVTIFCNILEFEIKTKPERLGTFFTINMNRLNLSGLDDAMFFIQSRTEPTDYDIQQIQDEILRHNRPSTPSFILCLRKSDMIHELAQKRFLSIVLIEENDLKKIALSSQPLQVFKQEVLIRQVKLSGISTYQTEGPVKNTFYGRQDEIGKILGKKERNFAIIGARRIGKTSLVFRMRNHLPTDCIPIYMDLEAPQSQNYMTFFRRIREEIKDKFKIEITQLLHVSNLHGVIKDVSKKIKKNLIFLLDEIDLLLKYDKENDYQLLKVFRTLSQEGYCQVILSGFKELYHAERDLSSPLYNLCEVIQLSQLKEKEALSLITEPMQSIGISYDNNDDRKLILEYTSCHPNLIQFFCKSLIEKIEENEAEENRRMIFRQDIEDVFQSFNYEKYVINEFYLFFTEDVSPIEKLIILLQLNNYPHKKTFSVPEILKILRDNTINISTGRLIKHLIDLRLRYILIAESGGKYRFALPIFPEILKRREDLSEYIKEIINDTKKSL